MFWLFVYDVLPDWRWCAYCHQPYPPLTISPPLREPRVGWCSGGFEGLSSNRGVFLRKRAVSQGALGKR